MIRFSILFRVLPLFLLSGLPALSAVGDADTAYNPDAGDRVFTVAAHLSGKFLAGGGFSSIGGVNRNHLARINPDGSVDAAFNPDVNGDVTTVSVQPDGKVIIGGDFSTVGGTERRRLARLNPDGTVDLAFNPDIGGGSSPYVHCTAVQPDGKILVGGTFSSVGGTGRDRIARINADGTVDPAFDPGTSGPVRGLAVQPDGKIIVCGQFAQVAGKSRSRIARLAADGTLDTAFNPVMNSHVNGAVVLTDGKILVCGEFTTIGTDTRSYIARLTSAGAVDTGFNPNPNAQVRCMSLQADGKVLIGGDFVSLGTAPVPPATTGTLVTRNRIARLSAEGAIDNTFNPAAGASVYAIALQGDGSVIAGGAFTSIGGQNRNRMARLANDSATDNLLVPGVTRIRWERGGATADTQSVRFELFGEGEDDWVSLGTANKIAAGWEMTGLSLPAAGSIRARALVFGGNYNGSAGQLESVKTFRFEPEIVVEQPAGTALTDNTGTVAFGVTLTGANVSRTFTIRNTGVHQLTGLTITFEGDHAPDFSVTSSPAAPVAPDNSTTFTVLFNSAIAGSKEAVLHLASNDADENPFRINLTARTLAPAEDADGDGLSNAAEILLAACGFDPLVSSTAKITELRAAGLYPASDIQALALTQPIIERNPVTGEFHLSVGLESSADLNEWTPMPDLLDFSIQPSGPGPYFYRIFGKKP